MQIQYVADGTHNPLRRQLLTQFGEQTFADAVCPNHIASSSHEKHVPLWNRKPRMIEPRTRVPLISETLPQESLDTLPDEESAKRWALMRHWPEEMHSVAHMIFREFVHDGESPRVREDFRAIHEQVCQQRADEAKLQAAQRYLSQRQGTLEPEVGFQDQTMNASVQLARPRPAADSSSVLPSSTSLVKKRCSNHPLPPPISKRRRFNAYDRHGKKHIINVCKKRYPTDEEQCARMFRTIDAKGWSRTKQSAPTSRDLAHV